MSAMLMIAPLSSMKATESGIRVFFIHMQWAAFSSNTKTMPAPCGIDLRYIRPSMRAPMLSATSARMRCMPTARSTAGNSAWTFAANSRASRQKIFFMASEKKKAGTNPAFFPQSDGLLLVRLLVVLLVHLFHLVGFLLHLVALLFHLVALLLHLVGLRSRVGSGDGAQANGREHGGNDHRQQLGHFYLSWILV